MLPAGAQPGHSLWWVSLHQIYATATAPRGAPCHAAHCSPDPSRALPSLSPQQEYKQHSSKKPAHSRIFFEFSDEPASQPQHGGGASGSAVGGGGSGSGDLQQVAFLQGQLREKDRRIQQVSTQLAEQEDRLQRVEQELEMARNGWVGGWVGGGSGAVWSVALAIGTLMHWR